MTLSTRLCATLLIAATGLSGIAATPVAAQTSISVQYRDYDRRDYGRRDYDRHDRRDYDRRDWRGDRGRDWDRRDGRRGYYGYASRRCWTDYRWDRWANRRVAVRYCR